MKGRFDCLPWHEESEEGPKKFEAKFACEELGLAHFLRRRHLDLVTDQWRITDS